MDNSRFSHLLWLNTKLKLVSFRFIFPHFPGALRLRGICFLQVRRYAARTL